MPTPEHLDRIKQGVDDWNRWREEAGWIQPDLWGAYIKDMDLREINLKGAKLVNAVFTNNNLTYADLSGADLSSADLRGSILESTNLSNVTLCGANLSRTYLKNAQVAGAQMEATVISDVDLSQVKGLELVRHYFRSEVSTSALELTAASLANDSSSLGAIDVFLRGTGVTDEYIEFFHSRIGKKAAYHSCFISYSSKDQEFVDRLYAALPVRGVRCWYAPEHLPTGDPIRPSIEESILRQQKFLLVLSHNSVESQWVEVEVETALEKERKLKELHLKHEVLFPLRLDNSILQLYIGWAADIKRARNIGDFCNWQDHDSYVKELKRLLRDLQMKDSDHTLTTVWSPQASGK